MKNLAEGNEFWDSIEAGNPHKSVRRTTFQSFPAWQICLLQTFPHLWQIGDINNRHITARRVVPPSEHNRRASWRASVTVVLFLLFLKTRNSWWDETEFLANDAGDCQWLSWFMPNTSITKFLCQARLEFYVPDAADDSLDLLLVTICVMTGSSPMVCRFRRDWRRRKWCPAQWARPVLGPLGPRQP